MAANPEILSNLKQYISDKTGGGDPPTGGDKDKNTKGGTPAPPNRIPLPDYNNPASRLNYAKSWTNTYGPLMQGRGDTPLRVNEIPNTANDSLTAKQIAIKAAQPLGLSPALLHASAMEEGMSGLYADKNGSIDVSDNPKFPVNGFVSFGLDNFADAYPGLVKKGYLPADFNKQFVKAKATNEKNQPVNSANFTSAEAAMKGKAAMLRASQDEVEAYAKQNKIPLSDKAKEFFTLVHYNAGSGNAQKMLSDYNKAGALTNDAFLQARPTSGPGLSATSWQQPYENNIRRVQMANGLEEQTLFDPFHPPPAQPIVNK